MKKYVFAFAVVFLGAAFYFFPERKDQEIFSSAQDKIHSSKEQTIQHPELGIINVPNSASPSMNQLPNNSIPPEALEELNSEGFKIQSARNAGYSGNGAELFIKNQPISISQMPKEVQPLLNAVLKEVTEKGYETTDEEEISRITDLENNLTSDDSVIKNLSFEPSKIPESLNEKYRYEGYVYDSVTYNPDNSQPANTVRRLYRKMDSNGVLVIEESTLENAQSSLVKEFVNASVSDSAAMYAIKKSPSNKEYSLLTWNGAKHSYTLYQYGDNTTQQELLEIAENLTKINN